MAKGNSGKSGTNAAGAGLRKSLLSIGADKESVGKLISSSALERAVIPLYWKDGLVVHPHPLWLTKLPSFLKSFEEVFPDGQVRWDPNYEENNAQAGAGDYAIRVFFNYQEDDQGDHWSQQPTEIEAESYQKMLKRASYTGPKAVQASTILRGR